MSGGSRERDAGGGIADLEARDKLSEPRQGVVLPAVLGELDCRGEASGDKVINDRVGISAMGERLPKTPRAVSGDAILDERDSRVRTLGSKMT